MTAYTTTLHIMIQALGELIGPKSNLNNACVPKYFIDICLSPWYARAVSEGKLNFATREKLITALQVEINRPES